MLGKCLQAFCLLAKSILRAVLYKKIFVCIGIHFPNTVNSRYIRENEPQIYVCYIVKNAISSEFYMVKYVINFELFSVIKNNSVITMPVITRVDCINI